MSVATAPRSGTIQPHHIRWLIRRDMPAVLAIETACFEYPWTEDDFMRCLRNSNCIGMVAELDGDVDGFMIYELDRRSLHLLNFAVAPRRQRQSIGQLMIAKLKDKLNHQRRTRIIAEVRESNLDAQLFFRAMRFTATAVLSNYYPDCEEDAYQFAHHIGGEGFE